MELECRCGCVYEVPDVEDSNKITGKLIRCQMCWELEDEETIDEEVEESKAHEPKIKSRKKSCVFSPEADDIIRENYEEKIDRELVDIIKKELGEDYNYNQVKARRKTIGLFKLRDPVIARKSGKRKTNKKYEEIHLEFLRKNIDIAENNSELCFLFNKEFGLSISVSAMQCQMSLHGIKRKKISKDKQEESEESKHHEFNPNKDSEEKAAMTKRKGMSEEVVELIEESYLEKTDDELRELIADKFGVFHSVDKIEDYRESNGMARPVGWQPDEFNVESDED